MTTAPSQVVDLFVVVSHSHYNFNSTHATTYNVCCSADDEDDDVVKRGRVFFFGNTVNSFKMLAGAACCIT